MIMEMGKEIRRLRNDRGLTQEALAAALNVTAQTVSKWECGNSIPDVQMLPEIAVYFGVTIDQLFAMTPEQQIERIENHIYSSGLFSEAEQRQIEQQLLAIAEDPVYAGKAQLTLAELYNNQAEQYRLLAVKHGKALISWYSDYCSRHPDNRSALMWLLDNLIDDRRLTEAGEWLEKLALMDNTFRVPMYRYLIALAAGKTDEAEQLLRQLENLENQEWCWAITLGDIYTQRQEYDKAIEWYRRGQEMQPAPKYTDSAMSIAHICEIRGDKAGAIAAYREQLRLMREDWGIISGAECEEIEQAIRKLQ